MSAIERRTRGAGSKLLRLFLTFVLVIGLAPMVPAEKAYAATGNSSGGTLWGVGGNAFGQLAGESTRYSSPREIVSDVVSVASSPGHTAWITSSGDLYTVGFNAYGQLGRGFASGDKESEGGDGIAIPAKVASNVASVSCGPYHTAWVTTSGALYAAGDGSAGALGLNFVSWNHEPVLVDKDVVSVSCGSSHTAWVTASGDLYAVGWCSSFGRSGDSTFVPVKIAEDAALVSCGSNSTAWVTNSGDLYAVGSNSYRQFGGENDYLSIPTRVATGVSAVSCGAYHSAWITKSGDLYTAGANYTGQCGNGTIDSRAFASKVASNVKAVTCGVLETGWISTTGDMYVVGDNAVQNDGSYYLQPHKVADGVSSLSVVSSSWFWIGGTSVTDPSPGDYIPSDPEDPENNTIDLQVYTSHVAIKENLLTVPFYESMFDGNVCEYNHDIAKLSMALSQVAYSESINANGNLRHALGGVTGAHVDTFVEKDITKKSKYGEKAKGASYIYNAYAKMGIPSENVEVYWYRDDQYSWDNTHPGVNANEGGFGAVGYAIGWRDIKISDGSTVPLAVVMIRGTASNGEWNSNFNINNSGNYTGEHQGFQEAKEQVLKSIVQRGFNPSTVRMLITGHSRGAAVANLLGHDLVASGKVSNEHLFAYTFATPRCSMNYNAGLGDNIYNILNPEDFVPRVALKEWGYGRYGKDLYFPSKSTQGTYMLPRSKCDSWYSSKFGERLSTYANGTLEVYVFERNMFELSRTVDSYYGKNPLDFLFPPTPYVYFESLASYLANDSYLNLGKFLYESVSRYAGLTMFFIVEERINSNVMTAHQPETYLAWMLPFDGAGYLFGSYDNLTKRVSFKCPVDIYVYDAEDNLVCRIENDVVDEDVMAMGLAAMVNEEGAKIVDLPDDGSYRVEVVARGEGTMDVSIQEIESDGVSVIEQAGMLDVDLVAPDGSLAAFTMDVPEQAQVPDLVLKGQDDAPSYAPEQRELGGLSVSVTAEGQGFAWGPESATFGDHVSMGAEPAEGWQFDGWYDADGTLLETGETYAFRVEADTALTARFSQEFQSTDSVSVYRLYNPHTSEHLFTTDFGEYQDLVQHHWVQEGECWRAPADGVPVYRLYNAGLGAMTKMSHHYTSDRAEIEVMLRNGWTYDFGGAPVFYSADENSSCVPVFRLYNDGLSAHHFTLDVKEYANLIANHGWDDEDVAFYAYRIDSGTFE